MTKVYLCYIFLKKEVGLVYLLGDKSKEGVYKIGVTNGKIETRIKKLQTGNGGEIYLVNSFDTKYPFVLEKMLHTKYYGFNTTSEWYELPDEDVVGFIETCKLFQKSIDALKENHFFKKKYNKKNDNLYE